jgi:hypothetical protein
MLRLIRFPLWLTSALALAACATLNAPPKQPQLPKVDLTGAKWQKLSPAQPETNPVRVAIVARDEKIGLTRVVIKAPANFTLPPYWLAAPGNYTVLKGTFVFRGHDAYGSQITKVQKPGAFAEVHANLIQDASTAPGEEGLLYITVYGDWQPNFAQGAFRGPRLRAGS